MTLRRGLIVILVAVILGSVAPASATDGKIGVIRSEDGINRGAFNGKCRQRSRNFVDAELIHFDLDGL